jgi:hypothetical protein
MKMWVYIICTITFSFLHNYDESKAAIAPQHVFTPRPHSADCSDSKTRDSRICEGKFVQGNGRNITKTYMYISSRQGRIQGRHCTTTKQGTSMNDLGFFFRNGQRQVYKRWRIQMFPWWLVMGCLIKSRKQIFTS